MIDADTDDTARLVLMDKPDATFSQFVDGMRATGVPYGLMELRDAFARYRGWDGRCRATHDVATGSRL